jgi:tetratricopeptide (TPR) repeat protein
MELGGALVHAVRGRDEEGAAVLHEALASATDLGDLGLATKSCRELGFIDVQAGRRERADAWLGEAERLAQDDDGELAAILGVRGMNLSDRARYPEALVVLEDSVDRAGRSGARRQQAWSMSLIGRLHHLRGSDTQARSVLDTCLGFVREERWTAFSPWPETLIADVDLADQRLEEARDRYGHAFALACQLGDPCWEGVAAKGLAMVEAQAGDPEKALTWLIDAHARCTRWPDTYQWVHTSVLDATASFLIEAREERGADYVEQLASLAARTGMQEFVIRSHIHRARLGQPGALEAAVIGVAQVDNPVLADLVDEARRER